MADQAWEVRAGQVYLLRHGRPTARTYGLIVARNRATGEVKYFVSNAPPQTPLAKLPRVAFRRWNVEHAFRVSKTEIGFGHFEGRNYVALMRHLILCLLVMGFVSDQTERLRGEKPRDHVGAGVPGVAPALRRLAGEAPAGHRSWCIRPRSLVITSGVIEPPDWRVSDDHPCACSAVVLGAHSPHH